MKLEYDQIRIIDDMRKGSVTLLIIVKISYVGGCIVKITILPLNRFSFYDDESKSEKDYEEKVIRRK